MHTAYFTAHPDRDLLPIVDDERPLGLIVRNDFVERFSRPFHHELLDNKSCKVFMDRNPLVAEHEEPLVDLGTRAAATSHHAASGLGAGLGLITIARNAVRPLEYRVHRHELEPETCLFQIQTII